MLCLLDASKIDDALALVTDLSNKLEDRTLEVKQYKRRPQRIVFRCAPVTDNV